MSSLRSRNNSSRTGDQESGSRSSSSSQTLNNSQSHTQSRSQSQDQSRNQNQNRSESENRDNDRDQERRKDQERKDAPSKQYEDSSWVLHAPLPAVKGTFGGVDSPRRRHLHSPSLSTLRGDSPSPYPSLPPTPTPHVRPDQADGPDRNDKQNPESSQELQRQQQQQEERAERQVRKVYNPNAPVFRADPTVKSCFDHLPLDKASEIKSLFNA